MFERFGYNDVMDEVTVYLEKHKRDDVKEVFDNAPYIGYFYVPVDMNHEFWVDYNYCDIQKNRMNFLKMKAIKCDENNITYLHYNSHEELVYVLKRNHLAFVLVGNELYNKSKLETDII